jgi:hypothetical protein
MVVNFIRGRNPSTQRKPLICRNLIAVKLGNEEALIDLLWWFVVLGTALYLQMYKKKSYRIKLNSEMFKKKKKIAVKLKIAKNHLIKVFNLNLNYEKKVYTVMVNNSTNINKTNNHLLP